MEPTSTPIAVTDDPSACVSQIQAFLGFDGQIQLAPQKALNTVFAGSSREETFAMVPVKRLRVMPGFNPRIRNARHAAHIRRIANSMLLEGYYPDKPLAVVSGHEGTHRQQKVVLFITEGGCRFEALQLAIAEGAQITEVPCVFKPRSTTMGDLTRALVKSNQGLEFTPLEVAIVVARMQKNGLSVAEIAHDLDFTEVYIHQLLTIASAPPAIILLIESGEVTVSTAFEAITQHGAEATEILQQALKGAKDSGKTKISRKDLPKQIYKRALLKAAPSMVDLFDEVRTHTAFKRLPPDLRLRIDELMAEVNQARAAIQVGANDKTSPNQLDLLESDG